MALASWAGTLAGQVRDSVPPDSLQRDTTDYTARFLEVQGETREFVPVLPQIPPNSPQPPFSRLVFTRDSLDWNGAGTVSDLLMQIPGVFVWRGGWLLQPEMVDFRGRGAASVEYILDGQLFLPMGPDSTAVDAGRFVLGLLDRVEVERWPDRIRVFLYSRRHDKVAPASRLVVATGDQAIARYQVNFEKRWRSGIGVGLAGDFVNVPTGSFEQGDRVQTSFWAQLSYVPSTTFGVQYQLYGIDIDRDPIRAPSQDSLTDPLDGGRRTHQLRAFWANRGGGLGWRADALLARSEWSGSGIDQSTTQYDLRLSRRSPTASFTGRIGGDSRWTPLDVRAEGGWTPTRVLSASAEAVYQRHDGIRTSSWLGLRAGLEMPLGFRLAGTARVGEWVASPTVRSDTAQTLNEGSVTVGFHRPAFDLILGGAHTAAFSAPAFQPYRIIDAFRPSASTDWVTAYARVRPVSWLTVDGWYSEAIDGAPDGQPPTQAFLRGAIRSKFLNNFPSGIFDLKLQFTLEYWGAGPLGVDTAGTVVSQPGATFVSAFLQLQIGGFKAFWERRNLLGRQEDYLPGYNIPQFVSVFGVRWDFLN